MSQDPSLTVRLRRRLEYLAMATLYLVARPVPRSWLLAIGRALGTVVWRVIPIRRKVVLENLAQAFEGSLDRTEQKALARRFYRNLGMTLMEFLAMPRLTRADILDLVRIEGREHLDAVLQDGRGVVFVSGHFGNFEYLGARVAAEVPISFVAKRQRNERIDGLQLRIRSSLGVGTVLPEAMRDMLRNLRDGQCLGMLADQNAGPDGLLCTFLGRPAWVFRGPAYLCWKLNVPMVTGFIFRDADGRHVARADPPVYPDRSLPEDEAIRALTEHHVRRLEAAVREAPDHYYWVHRRWKVPPEVA